MSVIEERLPWLETFRLEKGSHSPDAARAAQPTLNGARSDAAAAGAAARVAARVAARAAARDAAWAAAGDAAGAAAGGAALAPTVKTLQASALLLLDRLIEVGAHSRDSRPDEQRLVDGLRTADQADIQREYK